MRNVEKLILLLVPLIAFSCVKSRNIVVIGDSNGASPIGWVVKLDSMLVNDSIRNYSIAGNTIGFDNNGRESLNALKNIRRNLENADSAFNQIDIVIVALGTNDCKVVFDSVLTTVPDSMRKLINLIQSYPYKTGHKPEVVMVSPPQVAPDTMLLPKYYGIGNRLDYLVPQFENVAKELNCKFINVRTATSDDFIKLTADGIHFNSEGYLVIANTIVSNLQ